MTEVVLVLRVQPVLDLRRRALLCLHVLQVRIRRDLHEFSLQVVFSLLESVVHVVDWHEVDLEGLLEVCDEVPVFVVHSEFPEAGGIHAVGGLFELLDERFERKTIDSLHVVAHGVCEEVALRLSYRVVERDCVRGHHFGAHELERNAHLHKCVRKQARGNLLDQACSQEACGLFRECAGVAHVVRGGLEKYFRDPTNAVNDLVSATGHDVAEVFECGFDALVHDREYVVPPATGLVLGDQALKDVALLLVCFGFIVFGDRVLADVDRSENVSV